MSAAEAIAASLRCPESLPLELIGLKAELTYSTPGDQVAERAEEIEDSFTRLAQLVTAGVLSRAPLGSPVTTIATTRPAADVTQIELTSPGVHLNIVPVIIRLFYRLHQSPSGALDDLITALGSEEEARSVFHEMDYARDIRGLALSGVLSTHDAPLLRTSPLQPVAEGVPVPASGQLPAVIEAEEIRATGFPPGAELDADLEDHWLSLSMCEAFVPLGSRYEFTPGDEEMFFHEGELLIQRAAVEGPYLAELLGCLTSGHTAGIRVTIA